MNILSNIFKDVLNFKDVFKVSLKFDLFNGFKLLSFDNSRPNSDNSTTQQTNSNNSTQKDTVFIPSQISRTEATGRLAMLHKIKELPQDDPFFDEADWGQFADAWAEEYERRLK